MLKGKKTYISAAIIGGLAAAHALGFIDDITYQTLIGLAGSVGLASLRAAVSSNS